MSPPVVDIDEYRSLVGQRMASSTSSGCHVIGSSEEAACPCCNTPRHCQGVDRETLNEPSFVRSTSKIRNERNLIDDVEDEDDDGSTDEERDALPGLLHSGVHYHPTRILVEGWVHKKGTGNDIFGSRAWKARYCRLVVSSMFPCSDRSQLLCAFTSIVC